MGVANMFCFVADGVRCAAEWKQAASGVKVQACRAWYIDCFRGFLIITYS